MPSKNVLISWSIRVLAVCALPFFAASASADFWEISTGLNYNRSTYSGGSYSWTRRLGGSVGYNFSDSSMIEVAFQKSRDRTYYQGFEDSTFDDRVYSVNMVWNLLGKQAVVQPYLKVGIGQLNRKASIIDPAGRSQIQTLNQVTGVIGGGIRVYLTKQFAIRFEGTSYLSGAKLNTWRDNFGATLGGSFYF